MSITRNNEDWIADLNAPEGKQAEAIADLWELLKHGCRYTIHRHPRDMERLDLQQIEQFVEDCAQDALLSVLKHVSEFRGDSKFTTWAFKFAINVTLTAMRRESWKNISLDQLLEQNVEVDWPSYDNKAELNPSLMVHRKEVWISIKSIILNDLTEKQQLVIKLMVFEEVPMDVVVEKLGTNRNAVYKLLHDARLKLKQQIQSKGFGVDEVIRLFTV